MQEGVFFFDFSCPLCGRCTSFCRASVLSYATGINKLAFHPGIDCDVFLRRPRKASENALDFSKKEGNIQDGWYMAKQDNKDEL